MVEAGGDAAVPIPGRFLGNLTKGVKLAFYFQPHRKAIGQFAQQSRGASMNEVVKSQEQAPAEAGLQGIELGKWMGRREAFGLIAGRCSAADIESLRQIRDGKLYEGLNCNWDEFCSRHLHVPRRTVEREIGYLRRFGPAFFTLRQISRISVREYASLAEQISEEGVRVDGTVVALIPENSGPLAGALETLRKRNESAAPAAPPAGLDAVLQRLRSATQGMRSLEGSLDRKQLRSLAEQLAETLSAAAACGVALGVR
jgi:hypothetical protein